MIDLFWDISVIIMLSCIIVIFVYIPTISGFKFLFPVSSSAFFVFWFWGDTHSNWSEATSMPTDWSMTNWKTQLNTAYQWQHLLIHTIVIIKLKNTTPNEGQDTEYHLHDILDKRTCNRYCWELEQGKEIACSMSDLLGATPMYPALFCGVISFLRTFVDIVRLLY